MVGRKYVTEKSSDTGNRPRDRPTSSAASWPLRHPRPRSHKIMSLYTLQFTDACFRLDECAGRMYFPLGAENWCAYRRSFCAASTSSVSDGLLIGPPRAVGNKFRDHSHAFIAKREFKELFCTKYAWDRIWNTTSILPTPLAPRTLGRKLPPTLL